MTEVISYYNTQLKCPKCKVGRIVKNSDIDLVWCVMCGKEFTDKEIEELK